MEMKLNVIVLLVICSFSLGCGAKLIAYEPNTTSVTDPKAVIYRVIEEQPGGHTPQIVEVEDAKFKVTISASGVFYSYGSVGFYDSGLETSVVYYDSIETVELYSFRDYYNILIKNESGKVIYRVATYDLNKAKSFVDALHAMIERN
jgi:hypothetical protein